MEKDNFGTEKYKDIKTAWGKFVKYGVIDKNVIRSIIANSWLRCREADIDPLKKKNKNILKQHEIHNLLKRNQFLIQAASPIIKVAGDLITGSGFKINLVSSDGYILKTITRDKEVIKRSQEIGSIVGGNRSELVAGTNGIGLALTLGKTVQIIGPEHYNIYSHDWTCACAPIRNNKNEITGAVNISAYSHLTHIHTKGMAGSIASAIEKAVLNEQKVCELTNMNKFLGTLIDSIHDGLIVLDTKKNMTHLNSIGAEILGKKPEQLIGKKLDQIAEVDLSLLEIFETKRQYIDKETTLSLPFYKDKRQYLVTTSFIKDLSGNITNIMAVFREMKRVQRLVGGIIGAKARFTFKDIIHKSNKMEKVIQIAEKIAMSDCKVLISGESGTGKELFAQSIHNGSIRKNKPFLAVDCAALPRDLVESELFGYDEGAFTGAKKGGRPGKFELADGGTLFLDEIQSVALDIQPKLLRVIESGEIMRLSGNRIIPINVRIISSTNEDLSLAIQERKFRSDLFFRLNTTVVDIPPLRERKEDISVFVKYFITKLGYEFNENSKESRKVLEAFSRYNWPGNVRELENVIENIIILSPNNKITYNLLPEKIKNYEQNIAKSGENSAFEGIPNLNLDDIEKNTILRALKKNDGNNTKAAFNLGINRTTLIRKKKKYQIK